MDTVALLDGDILCFRVGFSCESKDEQGNKTIIPIQLAYWRLNEMVQNTLNEVGINPDDKENYRIYLTDSDGNFRKVVSPDYKANRKDLARPVYLPKLEQYLINEWGAERAVKQEADDLMGINQTYYWEHNQPSIICSIDKDLKQIPGSHYNFVKCEFDEVSVEDGMFFFYKQLLMGDTTDNIGGCPGIGPKKAEKILRPAYGNELELYKAVYNQYKLSLPELCDEELTDLITTVGRLVYIRRHTDEMWSIPK